MREDVKTDAQDLRGRTPLSLAAEAGRERTVSLLLAGTGTLVDMRNTNGQTPLIRAVSEGQTVVVEMLLARMDMNVNSKRCTRENTPPSSCSSRIRSDCRTTAQTT